MLFAIIAAVILIADQWLKYWVTVNITLSTGSQELIPGVVKLVNIHNSGAAFGLLDKLKDEYAKPQAERQLPVFVARLDDGTVLNVLAVYGAGLWGPIWGYIALGSDWDTIRGAVFDHQGETPGLGAEITTPAFSGQFIGKTIFDGEEFTGIAVLKGAGASAGNDHAVDAISGGTITSRGVESMLRNCLEAYLPLIRKQQAAAAQPELKQVSLTDITVENHE